MVMTAQNLALERCPHCFTANPTLNRQQAITVQAAKTACVPANPGEYLQWHVYICNSCAGLVAAASVIPGGQIMFSPSAPAAKVVPDIAKLSTDIPPQAARYLVQARETLSSPSASVITSASAVDAMLKARGYKEGVLFSRIQKAEDEGVLTKDMARWAHDVRLDANDERHAGLDASALTFQDATRCLEFAEALADLLFILPARVKRGLKSSPATGAKQGG